MTSEQQYIDLFKSQQAVINNHSAGVINAQRSKAFEDFCRIGFPSMKVERYKYTDIQKLFAPDYGLNLNRIHIPVNPFEVFRCDVPNITNRPYFVVNDTLYDEGTIKNDKSQLDETKDIDIENSDFTVCSLSEIAANKPEFIEKYYAKIAHTEHDGITALNTMLAQEGLFIYIPRGKQIEDTIQVINILRSDVDMMINRRVIIVVEEGAAAKLLFCDHAADDRNFLTTQVIEVFVGERASLELYCMEETHYKNVRISNLYIEQQKDSHLSHHSLTLHNGTTRNRTDLTFRGEGAECVLNGCVIADREQHIDNNILIDHKVPNCTSNELYKYVLDEKAVGAFAGRVLVEKGADKTSSQETNQNLLTTDTARMFTQPELEIYADDVKCAHGSTVGQLDDAALFYMRQRGISLKEAKLLLQTAFVGEIIDKIMLPSLRDRLRFLVDKRFRGELNKCAGCKMCAS